ncbi:helix-turn-helix transcriptional regulator [Mucilaginibacter sp. Bleaf8]|uniref:helix-turn-helix domain-containing protein n=1 Tax=Mucilaginibacter sp. Bleaf8 TaxID=2834430 RepID=UPI001BD179A5|nr:AraC family transcriptional regulator [Mucilaginibacter sp. Bleaf8]MBS7562911.1 helix-turn-helix transcriptional regulator [Mucilaginibacter sp. Bleaf8]
METVPVPDLFLNGQPNNDAVVFVPYTSSVPVIKGRASLGKHMISLITEGEKVLHIENKTINLTPNHILLLAAGNVLFTERLGPNAQIKSTMIFFDGQTLHNALEQFQEPRAMQDTRTPYLLFNRDNYLHSFIESVNTLMDQELMNSPLMHAKLNELLAYLNSKHPGLLASLRSVSARPEEERLRQVIEAHLTEQLTLTELAFLCHMSLATFKRKFEQVYHESPARWLQIQRLTLAANKLRAKAAKPGDVYVEAGYENHSSFSKAFKQYFGVLPKNYVP